MISLMVSSISVHICAHRVTCVTWWYPSLTRVHSLTSAVLLLACMACSKLYTTFLQLTACEDRSNTTSDIHSAMDHT